ncbi:P-loop containing nucleoside triphosphate hydrolase protein [Morchella conica CCBAS932]|uniref:P-loop containing nucleoside triphosphate hydrolase protein n=1 Tax=Morchella conica CCBAS932 TaxID=1392247 RepID=A0A3N4LDX7_9PEZI|nr:P-loop containing nucleoside triphosphate hydrolase protein [Morchella conica CCBAS932]
MVAEAPSIHVKDLTYNFPDGSAGLKDINVDLPPGSRTLLIGANGAGKTTLLRLASGKKLTTNGTLLIGGVDPFKMGLEGVTYLGLEWVLNPIVRNDIYVHELLASVGGNAYPTRRDELIRILDIDRRRVQLTMGLLRPWSILLLDEVTVDLDVLARSRFLSFLAQETMTRACTIVYATHIMDGLAGWPTHLVRMTLGTIRKFGPVEAFDLPPLPTGREVGGLLRNSALLELVLGWLREDLEERGPRGRKMQQTGR